MHDISAIEDARDRLRAIEQYLRGKQMHRPAMGAQRRLEARIGQLLGETANGRRHDLEPSRVKEGDDVAKNDRSDFRVLARALDGAADLTPDEWRMSRRALVALIKDRTKGDNVAQFVVVEPTAGARIKVPAGMTAEELFRSQ